MDEIRGSWGWFLALGILLAILGVACIVFDVTATFTTVLVFGWLLLISGVFALVQAFTSGPGADSSCICSARCSGDSPDTC